MANPKSKTEKFFMAFPDTKLSMFKKDNPLKVVQNFGIYTRNCNAGSDTKTKMMKIVNKILIELV